MPDFAPAGCQLPGYAPQAVSSSTHPAAIWPDSLESLEQVPGEKSKRIQKGGPECVTKQPGSGLGAYFEGPIPNATGMPPKTRDHHWDRRRISA